jgi:hypothetical protein
MRSSSTSSSSSSLLLSSSSSSATSFISFFESKTSSTDISTLVATLDNASLSKLLTSVQQRIDEASLHLASGGTFETSTFQSENNDPSESISISSSTNSIVLSISLLRCATRLVTIIFDNCEASQTSSSSSSSSPSVTLPRSFMETSISLHNSIAAIPAASKEGRACVSSIVRLCERIYLSKGDAATALLPLTVFQLILDASSPIAGSPEDASSGALLKRLWTLASRGALAAFDYDDESCDALRDAMLRSFTSGKVLSSSTGRDLLACFLTLCPSLTFASHSAIKAQFPAPIRVQEWYGAIYLRAWEESEGATRICVEEMCLQDLLHRGVHAADPATFDAVRRILSLFLQARDRKKKGVDSMLSRVASPILWRALECANAAVRRNAATFLKDAFPLGLSECAAAERDELVGKQLQALCATADDDCPGVREVGVAAIGLSLERFWEALPLQARLRLLERISARCEDGKAPSVRTAALLASASLIEAQPLCHSELLLRGFIPPLCKLIHDTSERVRVAAVKLLLSVERNHGILGAPLDLHIDSEQVLARLVMDAHTPIVAEGLSKLLLRSFFPPQDVRENEGLGSAAAAAAKRILDGLRAWELATLTFLAYLPRLTPCIVPKSLIVAVICKLHAAVHSAAETRALQSDDVSKQASKRSIVGEIKKSGEQSVADTKHSKTNSSSTLREVANILRAISTLWNGLQPELISHPHGKHSFEGKESKRSRLNKQEKDKEFSVEIDASTGALIAGEVDEDASIQSCLVSLFADEEIPFLLSSFCENSVSKETSSGTSSSSSSFVHAQSISASLLSIAAHLSIECATDSGIANSVWERLYRFTPSDVAQNGGITLQPIILCLSSWGLTRKLIEDATESLSNSVALITRTIATSSAETQNHKQMTNRQRDIQKGSLSNDELACSAFLGQGTELATCMHPVVAASVLELCFSVETSRNMLLNVDEMRPVMSSLADGVTLLVPTLQSRDLSTSAITLASIIAPACVRAWSRLTLLQIYARKTAAEEALSTSISSDDTIESPRSMHTLASDNIGDFTSWIDSSLLPILLSIDTTDFFGETSIGVTGKQAVLPIAASYSVLDELAALASDLLQGGMAGESAFNLFQCLSSQSYSSSSSSSLSMSKSPFDLCIDPHPLCISLPETIKSSSSSSFPVEHTSIPRLHSTLLRLGLRLFSASCGNILSTALLRNSSHIVETPIALPQGSKLSIGTSMGKLLCAGVLSNSKNDDKEVNNKEELQDDLKDDDEEDDDDIGFNKKSKKAPLIKTKKLQSTVIHMNGTQLVAREVTEQLLTEALKAQKRCQQGASSTTLSTLLSSLLSTYEASLPMSIVKKVFESKGDCIISLEDLQSYSAVALTLACTGQSSTTFKSTLENKDLFIEALVQRINLLTPVDGSRINLDDPAVRAVAIALAVIKVLPQESKQTENLNTVIKEVVWDIS